jgi:hypothetical protein
MKDELISQLRKDLDHCRNEAKELAEKLLNKMDFQVQRSAHADGGK